MRLPWILSLYLARQFFSRFIITVGVLSGVIYLFEILESLRKAFGKDISYQVILGMGALKLPMLIIQIMPFGVLVASILCFTTLTKTSEIAVARSAGCSLSRIVLPSLIVVLAIGIFNLMLFNQLSASMLNRYDKIQNKYWSGKNSFLSVFSSGLWLKEQTLEGGNVIIYAAIMKQKNLDLQDVTFYMLTKDNKFEKRIDAKIVSLNEGFWDVRDLRLTSPGHPVQYEQQLRLPTTIKPAQLQDSFASPQTIGFWELPGFISSLKDAGFSAKRHLMYFYQLLFSPLLLVGMALLAAPFSLSYNRRSNRNTNLVIGLFTGFFVYFLNDIVVAMGLGGKLPLFLAALLPPIIILASGMYLLLKIER